MYIKRKKIEMLLLGMMKWANYMHYLPQSCFIIYRNSRMMELEILSLHWIMIDGAIVQTLMMLMNESAPNDKKCITSTRYLLSEPYFPKHIVHPRQHEYILNNCSAICRAPQFSRNLCMPTYTHVYISTPYNTHAYINTPTNICTHLHTYIHTYREG